MTIERVERKALPDGSWYLRLQVPPEQRIFVGLIIESMENLAWHTTSPDHDDLEVIVPPERLSEFLELLEDLRSWRVWNPSIIDM